MLNKLTNISGAFVIAAGLGGCVTMEADAKTKHATELGCKKIQSGKASWYGKEMARKVGKKGEEQYNATASGVPFKPKNNLIAHKTLPFHTSVIVKDESTGRQIKTVVLDRGPFVAGRILDLSEGAANALGTKSKGIAYVSLYRCS